MFESDDEDDAISRNQILLEAVATDVQINTGVIPEVQGIRCAAHTLQLCIRDAVQKLRSRIQNVITLCRRIAKTMKLTATAHELNQAGIEFNVPHLDVGTRWCSTYIMVCN